MAINLNYMLRSPRYDFTTFYRLQIVQQNVLYSFEVDT